MTKQTMGKKRLLLLTTIVRRALDAHVKVVRRLHDRDQLRAAVTLVGHILEVTEDLEATLLEVRAMLFVPVHHADQGRDASDE